MSLPFLKSCSVVAALLVTAGADTSDRPLRVCADPNNLPFSNDRGEGFENQLARLLAHELNTHVEYTWWSQRRGFVRNTLSAGRCDLVMGVPTGFDLVLRSNPYYRSSYVFVSRRTLRPEIRTFDDPRLARLRIGVQMIGDDGANSPPAHALARRGIIENVRGYMVYGDYAHETPLAPIMRDVANGRLDVAVVWGPIAGYFAEKSEVPLQLTPVSPQIELPFLPFVFDIALGVRRGDSTLRTRLNDALSRRHGDVERLLDAYGVPRVSATRRTP